MTAPSLVLLGHGSHDPRCRRSAIRSERVCWRFDQSSTFTLRFSTTAPQRHQVVNKLVSQGVAEVVFVPLLLSDAFNVQAEVPVLLNQVQANFPQLRVIASRPIGPEAQLLSIIDRRLRDALRARRVSELDGLVFAAAGSTDIRSNALVARRARQWATHHRLPCVTAFATGSGPSSAEAIRTSAAKAGGTLPWAAGSWHRDCTTPGRPSSRSRPAQSQCPLPWAASLRSLKSPDPLRDRGNGSGRSS